MTDEELRERLGDKEDGWTERKSKGVSSEDIKKTIVAFANSLPEGHQGVLFIGIADKSGAVEGVDDPDKLQKNVRQLAERSVYPPIYLGHNCRVLREAGKDVVAVIVDASNNRPHFAGASYVRVGSESVAASERQFEHLIASRTSVARFILEAMRKDETVLIEEAPDGIQAIKVVRQHAAEWGVSPDRVGLMGFSAGAMVASGALLQQDAAARPSFAAMIYGGPFGRMPAIPAKLPPTFLAWGARRHGGARARGQVP